MREERSNQHQKNKTIIREYNERLYANKLGDLEEMDKSLEMCKRAKLKQEGNRKYKQTHNQQRN